MRLTLRYEQEKYDYNILVQPQHSNYIQDYQGIYVDTVCNVTNLTPTLDFHYNFTEQSTLRVQYRGDTQQPDITQLLDITEDSNPLYITQGNSGLKPSFTNSLNLYYNNYITRYKRSVVVYAIVTCATLSLTSCATMLRRVAESHGLRTSTAIGI